MSTTTSNLGLTVPAMTDTVTALVSGIDASMTILDAMYPVGTIYQSTKSTNPSTFLGGTWTALTGRMLVGAGADFPAGTTGGEKTHTLTISEMPSHNHQLSWGTLGTVGDGAKSTLIDWGGNVYTQSSGGNGAHNNMPPYRAVYMWERTA